MHIISVASIEDFTCLVFLSAHSLLVSHISHQLLLTLQISFCILVDVISVTYITDSVSITASLGDFILSSQIALHMIQTSQISLLLALHISFQLILPLRTSFPSLLSSWIYCSCYVRHRLHFRKYFLLQSYISFLLYTSIHIFIFNCYLH